MMTATAVDPWWFGGCFPQHNGYPTDFAFCSISPKHHLYNLPSMCLHGTHNGKCKLHVLQQAGKRLRQPGDDTTPSATTLPLAIPESVSTDSAAWSDDEFYLSASFFKHNTEEAKPDFDPRSISSARTDENFYSYSQAFFDQESLDMNSPLGLDESSVHDEHGRRTNPDHNQQAPPQAPSSAGTADTTTERRHPQFDDLYGSEASSGLREGRDPCTTPWEANDEGNEQ
ncbi:hypothetical protein QBC44DRAFT_336742 [Cladorrhinum sp. PSN332]|nr:hypothetical protein QBC44DRAFT_336742 [Cladorrhinum sp. PSN332]